MNSAPQPKERLTVERTVYQVVRFVLVVAFLAIVSFSIILLLAMRPMSYELTAPPQLIEIRSGAAAQEIARLLEREGIIRDERYFRLLLRLREAETSLQAGTYRLNPTMRPNEIITILREGRSEMERIVIPEGYELRQIADVLAAAGLVDRQRFLQLASDASTVFGNDLPFALPIPSLEGYLFPDTYRFVKGQSEESIIRQMVGRFLDVVQRHLAPEMDNTELTLHELVTLASIVEKEIRIDEERTKVAGVYLNRLAINMRLQADPTVRYVMTEERDRVLYRDLEIDSPYNTYRNHGLPPGPIASPGLASMLAVIHPADVDYLFFVARGDGSHQFSRTFEEHVAARRALGY